MSLVRLGPIAPRTLSDEVTERLRNSIKQGLLPPGTRLVERNLAEQLGVSRIPIREAIHRLVEEGLVTKLPRRGTFVYHLSPNEIEEISSLRVVLERFVVERAIAHWKPEHEEFFQQVIDQMRTSASEQDFQKVYEQDFQFHLRLWQIADHSLLFEVVSGLRSRISRFLYEAASAMRATSLFDIYIASHTELLDVLKSRDVAAAQAAITKHVLESKDRILAYYYGNDGQA